MEQSAKRVLELQMKEKKILIRYQNKNKPFVGEDNLRIINEGAVIIGKWDYKKPGVYGKFKWEGWRINGYLSKRYFKAKIDNKQRYFKAEINRKLL